MTNVRHRHAGSRPEPGARQSPLERALAGVGDRWALLIVDALLDGPRRYGELSDSVGGIAPNILADRLRRLTDDGLIVGEPYQHRPRRLAYRLSADGAELAGALAQLGAWAARREGLPAPHYHATCGSELELRPWCPTCQDVVGEHDADDLDRL
jgi:DNA-binding HxlR family transcriptional regulator